MPLTDTGARFSSVLYTLKDLDDSFRHLERAEGIGTPCLFFPASEQRSRALQTPTLDVTPNTSQRSPFRGFWHIQCFTFCGFYHIQRSHMRSSRLPGLYFRLLLRSWSCSCYVRPLVSHGHSIFTLGVEPIDAQTKEANLCYDSNAVCVSVVARYDIKRQLSRSGCATIPKRPSGSHPDSSVYCNLAFHLIIRGTS